MAATVMPGTLVGVRTRVMTLVLLVAGTAFGCTSDGTESGPEDDEAATPVVPSVTAPPVRLTPFCQQMLDLDERVRDLPADQTGEVIIEGYREALPDVPPEIEVEFAAVLDALERGTEATLPPTVPQTPTPPTSAGGTAVTEDTFFEEGYLPDDDPAARVNEYIDFACRGTQNNPGPPATQPGGPPTTNDDG